MTNINLKKIPTSHLPTPNSKWQNIIQRKELNIEPWSFEPKDSNQDNIISAQELLATTPASVKEAAQKLAEDINSGNESNKTSIVALGHNSLVAPQGLLSELIAQYPDKEVYFGVDIPSEFSKFIKELNTVDLKSKNLEEQSQWLIDFQERFFKAYELSFEPPMKPMVTDVWSNNPIYNGDNVILNREALAPSSEQIRQENLNRIQANAQKAPQITDQQKQGFWSMMDMLTTAKFSGAQVFVFGQTNARTYGSTDGAMNAANDLRDKSNQVPRGSVIIASLNTEDALKTFAKSPFKEAHPSKNLVYPTGAILSKATFTLNVRNYNVIVEAPETQVLTLNKQPLSVSEVAQLQTHLSTLPADGWDKILYVKAAQEQE